MSFTTVPQSTLPENRPTRLVTHPSGYNQPRRSSPYPVLPRHLPTDFGPRNSWVAELDHPYTGRHRRDEQSYRRPAPRTEAEYTARLQEIAWDRFLRKTADLAACHVRQSKPPLAIRLASAVKHAFATITRRSRTLPAATT